MVWQVGSRRGTSRRVLGRPRPRFRLSFRRFRTCLPRGLGGTRRWRVRCRSSRCVFWVSPRAGYLAFHRVCSLYGPTPRSSLVGGRSALPRVRPRIGLSGCWGGCWPRFSARRFRRGSRNWVGCRNPRPLLGKGSLRRWILRGGIRRSFVEGLGNGVSGLRGRLAGVGTRAPGRASVFLSSNVDDLGVILYGLPSGMVPAAAARVSWGYRNAW